ncbi:MAG: sugar ABC transporter ATP-binding protein [Clostridiales bacterium]|nr:sugar ABC transporter ATP-binding protein [Clostridiales bacterium]
MEQGKIVFEVQNMHKAFGQTIALKNVSLTLREGEIRGLVGENGSGKSTIMSIASGMQSATKGTMIYQGKPWNPANMVEAQAAGISMILQEANTIPGVTVAQNIFAGREREFSKMGIINMQKMYRAADEVLERFGIGHIKGRHMIDQYTFEERKLIELVRCVNEETKILVVDETTTALSLEGRQILYKLIHRMAEEENKTVVFVSHDMDEILEHCSVLTVLRDGDIVGELDYDEIRAPGAAKQIRYLMVGREIGEKYYREDYDSSHEDTVALELKHVTAGLIQDFSLVLHKGEILGFGGLSGCGMHEVGRIAYGLEKLQDGQVLCGGHQIKTPLQAIQSGIGYISKNRDNEALILDGSIQDNIVLPSLSALESKTYISPKKEKTLSDEQIEAFRIKCGSGKQWVNTLSGGNKQKVSFAKWTAKGSDVIIMDCPTRGVDIGVKQSMYALIEEMKKEGKAILMISEELSELVGMADKLVIMKDFKVTAEFERSPDLKQTDIIEYMI